MLKVPKCQGLPAIITTHIFSVCLGVSQFTVCKYVQAPRHPVTHPDASKQSLCRSANVTVKCCMQHWGCMYVCNTIVLVNAKFQTKHGKMTDGDELCLISHTDRYIVRVIVSCDNNRLYLAISTTPAHVLATHL